MDDKLLKKLSKVLSKLGIDEDKKNEILTLVETEKDDTEPTDNETVSNEGATVETAEPSSDEVPPESVDELPSDDDVQEPTETENENDVVEEVVDDGQPEQNEQTETLSEQPQEQELPQAKTPNYDLKFDEFQKALDGLTARIDSLDEALKKSGAITITENAPVGVDQNITDGTKVADSGLNAMLKKMNATKY